MVRRGRSVPIDGHFGERREEQLLQTSHGFVPRFRRHVKQTPPRTEMVSGVQGRRTQDTYGVGRNRKKAQERSLGQLNGRLANGRQAGG